MRAVTHVHARTRTHARARMHAHMHALTRTHAHMHTLMHTHTLEEKWELLHITAWNKHFLFWRHSSLMAHSDNRHTVKLQTHA